MNTFRLGGFYLINQNKHKRVFVVNQLLDLLKHLCDQLATLQERSIISYSRQPTLVTKKKKKTQVYLWEPLWEQTVAVYLNKLTVWIPAGGKKKSVFWNEKKSRCSHNCRSFTWGWSHRLDSLIDSFWARALHRDVFPVPGGPESGQRKTSVIFLFSINNSHCRNSLFDVYREAEQHDSMKSGCCQLFCLRSKLLLWRNPGAEGKGK